MAFGCVCQRKGFIMYTHHQLKQLLPHSSSPREPKIYMISYKASHSRHLKDHNRVLIYPLDLVMLYSDGVLGRWLTTALSFKHHCAGGDSALVGWWVYYLQGEVLLLSLLSLLSKRTLKIGLPATKRSTVYSSLWYDCELCECIVVNGERDTWLFSSL